MSKSPNGNRFMKALTTFLKDAGMESFVPKGAAAAPPEPGSPEHESEEMSHVHALEELHSNMGKALEGIPAEHPMHGVHKALGEHIAAMKEAMHKEADASASAGGDNEMGPDVQKSINAAVAKRTEAIQKQLDDVRKQAAAAEETARVEKAARELSEVKVVLRKYQHLTLDIEKEAPIFKKAKDTDPTLFASLLEKLDAAEAVAKKAGDLERALGTSAGGSGVNTAGGSAWAEICAEADKLIAKDASGLTKEQARNRVMETNLPLVKRYFDEQKNSEAVISAH